ncbi:MAG: hypothetical protein AB8G05_21350 [Oligoflexales bacterium]
MDSKYDKKLMQAKKHQFFRRDDFFSSYQRLSDRMRNRNNAAVKIIELCSKMLKAPINFKEFPRSKDIVFLFSIKALVGYFSGFDDKGISGK